MPTITGNSAGILEGPRPPDRCGPLLGSLCGPKACRLCCRCCPSIQESTSTKSIYCLVLVGCFGFMASMLAPNIQSGLQTIFRDFNATCIDLTVASENCMKLTGYMAIYKISFSVTFFYLFMSLLTLGVVSSKGARACIHNGFWFFKLLLIATIIVATFVIPISHTDTLHSGWIYVTVIGNCLFIFLQTSCLIRVSELMCKRLSFLASGSKLWRGFEILMAMCILALWLAMAIIIFISHGRQEYCLTKHLIIIFNAGFCIALVLAALTPCARTPVHKNVYLPGPPTSNHSTYGARLLQSGLMIVYITFWIWSAMQSSPENPGIIELSTLFVTSSHEAEGDSMKEMGMTCRHYNSRLAENGLLLAACLMMLMTIIYVCSDLHIINKGRKKNNRLALRSPENLFGPAGLSGIDLHQQAERMEDAGMQQRLKSSSSMSFNNSCSTSTSKVFKTSASEESETGICAFSQNQVECLREPENQRYANNLNRSFRRQRLQSATGHQRRGFTTLPNRNDSRALHNDATQLNYNLYDKRLTRMSFDAENAPNKTETDGGQTLIRNEINGTTYSYSFFHLTLALATMFMTTQLTRWFHPKELGEIVQREEILSDRSWSTVGVKIVCGWSCGLIYLVYLLMPEGKDRLCLSFCNCCPGRNKNTHRRSSYRTPNSSKNLSRNCSESTEVKDTNGGRCFSSSCLKQRSCLCTNRCNRLCISGAGSSCGSIILALSCCCFGIRKKSVFDRNGCVSERSGGNRSNENERNGFINGCNNILGIDTSFVRSSVVTDDDTDRIPSEAAHTDLTTVSPTPPPIQQITTNISSTDPYAVMFLPPPSKSTSDIFEHPYANYPQCGSTLREKSTFGTLPAPSNNHSTSFSNRYSYEGQSSQQGKTRTFVYMDSSPSTTPPKLPRRTVSTLNSTSGGHFTLSYM